MPTKEDISFKLHYPYHFEVTPIRPKPRVQGSNTVKQSLKRKRPNYLYLLRTGVTGANWSKCSHFRRQDLFPVDEHEGVLEIRSIAPAES